MDVTYIQFIERFKHICLDDNTLTQGTTLQLVPSRQRNQGSYITFWRRQLIMLNWPMEKVYGASSQFVLSIINKEDIYVSKSMDLGQNVDLFLCEIWSCTCHLPFVHRNIDHLVTRCVYTWSRNVVNWCSCWYNYGVYKYPVNIHMKDVLTSISNIHINSYLCCSVQENIISFNEYIG